MCAFFLDRNEQSRLVKSGHSKLAPAEKRKVCVLLAEDNSINRKVAVQILQNLSYQVVAVSNGKEAIEAFERSSYDIVILGYLSSEVDGYQAAAHLRRRMGSHRHVPIIALTASTMQSDRRKREEAGMDDYIALPISAETVATVLGRWDPEAKGRPATRLVSVDRSVVNELRKLGGEKNPTLLGELIELFIGSAPLRLNEMRQALDKGTPEFLSRAAHFLKGSAGQMGANRMQQICAAIETLGRAGTSSGVAGLVDELVLEFERVSHDLLSVCMEKGDLESSGIVPDPGDVRGVVSSQFDISAIASAFDGKLLVAVSVYPSLVPHLSSILKSMDCDLICSAESILNGLEAISGANVLLLGVRVGDLEPLEKCTRLRQQGLDVPIIVITALPDRKLLEYVEELGADIVLEPFRLEDILLRAYQKLRLNRKQAPTGDGTPKEVLSADDDPLIARFLVSTLTSAGFEATHVTDGEAALAAIEQKAFQLVILDINMPKTDGFGVLSALRLKPNYKSTPVLVLSSRTQEHDIVRAFDLGADDYVTKPFNPLEVVSRMRRLLRRK